MMISFLTYRFLSILIGILYPSYQTYKCIKYQFYDQYLSLLCYWILFSLFQIFEFLFDHLLLLIFPFYNELKLICLFWLTYKNLSQILFTYFILPYINKYENDIDYLFNNTIYRLTELILKLILFILNQQQITNELNPIKTNFASQYRKINSIQPCK